MSNDNPQNVPGNGALALRLVLMAVAMFGFGFLLVPMYDAFCDITGLGGKTNRAPLAVAESADLERQVDLEFVTTVNERAPWAFRPQVSSMNINPGALYEATFIARNLSEQGRVAQAVPSVSPSVAAKYLKKLDCFCFSEQSFAAGEERELQVRFIVANDLPEFVDTVTLSYTFFDSANSYQ